MADKIMHILDVGRPVIGAFVGAIIALGVLKALGEGGRSKRMDDLRVRIANGIFNTRPIPIQTKVQKTEPKPTDADASPIVVEPTEGKNPSAQADINAGSSESSAKQDAATAHPTNDARGGSSNDDESLKFEWTKNKDEFIYASREESLRFVWIGSLVFQLALLVAVTWYALVLIAAYCGCKESCCSYLTALSFFVGSLGIAGLLFWLLLNVGPRSPLHLLLFEAMQDATSNTWLRYATTAFNVWGAVMGLLVTAALVLLVNEFRANNSDPLPNAATDQLGQDAHAHEATAGGSQTPDTTAADRAKAQTMVETIRRDFRWLLFMSAAFLAAMTFQIFCELSWPSALSADAEITQKIIQMATASSFACGAAFTVIAGFIFLPVMVVFDPNLTLSPKTITELLAILAPLFTAISLAKLFGS